MNSQTSSYQVFGIAGILPLDFTLLLDSGESGAEARRVLESIPLPLPAHPEFGFGYHTIRKSGGGKITNVLAFLGSSGFRVGVCGVIGNDPAGASVLEDLNRYNVDHNQVEIREGSHTHVIFILYKAGWRESRQFNHKAAPLAKFSRRLLQNIPETDFLLVGRANESVNDLVRLRKQSGKTIICFHLDSIPWQDNQKQTCYELLGLADLIVTQKKIFQEAVRMARVADVLADENSPPRMVIGYGGANDVTTSTEGLDLVDLTPISPALVDPTGMMDVFHGALLSFCVREGWPMKRPLLAAALRYANAMAVEKAGGSGARAFAPYSRCLEVYEHEMQGYRRLSGPYYNCFLSFSHKDDEFVDKLYADLLKWGVPCWFAPESIESGEEFRGVIETAIRSRERLLLMVSENSAQSPWVKWEVDVALQMGSAGRGPIILPVLIADLTCAKEGHWFEGFVASRQVSNFRNWRDSREYEKALFRLLNDLKKK